MNLGDLLNRAYDALGVTSANLRSYSRASLVQYINRGTGLFRQQVQDQWIRYTIALVANQGVYNFDDDDMGAQRISFNDITMDPMTIIGLQGHDAKWETTPGSTPLAWTSDGLPHNQFRVYPRPTSSSADTITFDSERGVVTRILVDSVPATFPTDRGVIVRLDGVTFTSDRGEISSLSSTGLSVLEVWGTKVPQPLAGDGDEIPLKPGYELAPVYYALWHTYLEEDDHYDSDLAGLFAGLWRDLLQRADERKQAPLPNQIHVLGGRGAGRRNSLPSYMPTMLVNGNPVTVSWPRTGGFGGLGD